MSLRRRFGEPPTRWARAASWLRAATALGAAVAFGATTMLLGPYTKLAAHGILDERFAYGAAEAAAFLDGLGDAGRVVYVRFLLLDLLNGPLLGLALAALMLVSLRTVGGRAPRARLICIAAAGLALFDVLENTALLVILGSGTREAAPLLTVSVFTTAKHVCGSVALVSTVVALAAAALACAVRAVRPPVAAG